ncbi:hypothetical protein AAFF_G00158130 [Aldrovandia affinis]|uniref:Clathrin heavy chain linker domain-containing protein 1 n=1 Tax=Aldrovandia affinis TaxID=143900 RepID=A0AAD7RNE3_9TELE|nr:hypothetical protein AAFF_G00158130 [Aldrovandia affinis]
MCPADGPDEQRYIIYSSAFDKVIERTTAYKIVLTAIKKEYDDFLCAVKRSQHDARLAHGRLRALAAKPTSIMYYKKRAIQLQERIEIIQKNTAELHIELKRLQESRMERRPSQQETSDSKEPPPTGQIPGRNHPSFKSLVMGLTFERASLGSIPLSLTFEESVSLEALQRHLEHLEQKHTDLQRKKNSQYVSKQVKVDLENEVRCAHDRREKLANENRRLELRNRQMALLHEAFSSWEKSERAVPLGELLPSVLEQISHLKECDSDPHDVSAEASEEDDPAKAKESKLLSDYVKRFTELFEGREYEAAALHAARSPGGILRNMETLDRFKAIARREGELPPALLYFQALMEALPAGRQLPGRDLAVEGVRAALQGGCVELVTHWVSQRRLAFSEALGDVIGAHGRGEAGVADTCLALAQVVYSGCGLHRKAAVCMCRRGMISAARQFIHNNSKAFSVDDCLYVVRSCPSVALLQALTLEHRGRPAALSLGFAALSLLDTQNQELVFLLLERMQECGALEEAVLSDAVCTAEGWSEIAAHCRGRGRLARTIDSALMSLQGAVRVSPGLEGAKLMEHVFL